MYLTITYIRLRSVWQFFALSWQALKIVRQLKQHNNTAWKNKGFWRNHYTMTLWKSREDIDKFYTAGAHAQSMRNSAKISSEIATLTIAAADFLDWKIAKERVKKEGKWLKFE